MSIYRHVPRRYSSVNTSLLQICACPERGILYSHCANNVMCAARTTSERHKSAGRINALLVIGLHLQVGASSHSKRLMRVVVSPRSRRSNQLCTIVPLSNTRLSPVEPHSLSNSPAFLPGKFVGNEIWAKCDIVATVPLNLLARIMIGKDRSGKRLHVAHPLFRGTLYCNSEGYFDRNWVSRLD